jgi:hypothetical protein
MKLARWLEPEALLEGGLLALAVGCLGGLAVLVFGRAAGGADRKARYAERAPGRGSVPAERHHNTSGVPAR